MEFRIMTTRRLIKTASSAACALLLAAAPGLAPSALAQTGAMQNNGHHMMGGAMHSNQQHMMSTGVSAQDRAFAMKAARGDAPPASWAGSIPVP
jgi:hypothetical protein